MYCTYNFVKRSLLVFHQVVRSWVLNAFIIIVCCEAFSVLKRCPYLVYGCSPEVVEKDVRNWCLWSQVSIFFDSVDIVEHKAAVEAVVVDDDAGEDQHGSETAARRLRHVSGRGRRRARQPTSAAPGPRAHRRHHSAKPTHSTYAVHCESLRHPNLLPYNNT